MGFNLFFLIICYILMAFLAGGMISMLFQLIITEAWEKSNKTKYNWLVKTLYLDDEGDFELLAYDKRHPKWYKAIQIFIGITWPVYIPILFIGAGIYYFLYKLPIWVYKKILKEIYYWWIGDSKNK